MRRPDDAQVDLERGDAPLLLRRIAERQEVHAEPADDTVAREHGAHAQAGVADLLAVALVGGEAAPQVNLPGIAAEDLVVRRDLEHVA